MLFGRPHLALYDLAFTYLSNWYASNLNFGSNNFRNHIILLYQTSNYILKCLFHFLHQF